MKLTEEDIIKEFDGYIPPKWMIEIIQRMLSKIERNTFIDAANNVLDKWDGKKLYNEDEVEELLQKQRELCAEKARSIGYGWEINKDSILNAKLKID